MNRPVIAIVIEAMGISLPFRSKNGWSEFLR
jgi:hypothetical protein